MKDYENCIKIVDEILEKNDKLFTIQDNISELMKKLEKIEDKIDDELLN